MAVDDLVRLAWRAQQGGQRKLCEAMLTLAIGRAGASAPWAERCRARLLEGRPGHFLGARPDLGESLADPRVVRSLAKLSAQYPPARVGWLRLRFDAADGPFRGEEPPLGTLLDALIAPPAEAEARPDGPEPARARPAIFLGDAEADAERPADADAFYLAVLLAIAMLLATKPARAREAA